MFNKKANIKKSKIYKTNNGDDFLIFYGIDYRKMKLFFLSLLWRASITSRPFFQEVKLDAKHEERVREILFKGITPDELEYPILTSFLLRSETSLNDYIISPVSFKIKGQSTGFCFFIRGLEIAFFMGTNEQEVLTVLRESSINKNNQMTFFLTNTLNGNYNFLETILNKN